MNFPSELKYTAEHEWVKVLDDNTALVGITDFAQSELGDIVFIDIEKTVSDLFLPITGKVIEVNSLLADQPEMVNNEPYENGWLIKMEIENLEELGSLLSVEDYKSLTGH